MFSPEWFLVGILVILLIAQQGFWMYHSSKLMNKIMSRNYNDFVQGERLRKPTNVSRPAPSAILDPIAERNARDANRLLAL
jgi:hypothetical protein